MKNKKKQKQKIMTLRLEFRSNKTFSKRELNWERMKKKQNLMLIQSVFSNVAGRCCSLYGPIGQWRWPFVTNKQTHTHKPNKKKVDFTAHNSFLIYFNVGISSVFICITNSLLEWPNWMWLYKWHTNFILFFQFFLYWISRFDQPEQTMIRFSLNSLAFYLKESSSTSIQCVCVCVLATKFR